MGAHDVTSARIVERAGFDAIGLQSLQLSLASGLPDVGVLGPSDLVATCRRIRRATSLPIVVDFEQGFGEVYAAVHWMHELEAAGASALHIDDYGLPYKCTFVPPHEMGLEDVGETAAKIGAMKAERRNPDLKIIARPGSYVATVLPDEAARRRDWLMRAEAYTFAGADMLFAVCRSVEHAKFFRASTSLPLMTIRTLGTRQHYERDRYDDGIMRLSIDDWGELGYQFFIEPTTLLGVSLRAMEAAAARLVASGRSDSVEDQHGSLHQLLSDFAELEEVSRLHALPSAPHHHTTGTCDYCED